MASFFIKVLLAASLLAHTVLGCCWHHAHGAECSEQTATTELHCHADHAPHHATADHAAALSIAADVTHDHSAPCDATDCSYVKSAPPPLNFDHISAVAVRLTPSSAAAASRHEPRCASDDGARVTGAALRAVLQVWLT